MQPTNVKNSDAAGGDRRLNCTSAETAKSPSRTKGEASDEDLFSRVRLGDRESLAALVERYQSGLFALLVRLTGGDRHRADDLFQETFLRAVRAAETFDASKTFRPWLTAIAVNLVRDEARKKKLRGEVSLDGPEGEASGGTAVEGEQGPAERAERDDEARRIREALKRLTEKEREIVLLHFYNGMTLAQVAEALAIPVGTVKSRLHGALTRLKGILEP